MGWMKFVHQVYILGDGELFIQKVNNADKTAKKSIKYRGEVINLNRAKAIAQYLELHNNNWQWHKAMDDLLRR